MKLNTLTIMLAALACVASAQATPQLEINFYTGTPTGPNTLVASSGAVAMPATTNPDGFVYDFTIPNAVSVDIFPGSGASSNVYGTTSLPAFYLNVDETSLAASPYGFVTIAMSSGVFGPSDALLYSSFGGSVAGLPQEPANGLPTSSVTMAMYTGSSLFATTNLVSSASSPNFSVGNNAVNGVATTGIINSSSYALTEVITIAGQGTGSVNVSSSSYSQAIPDGATTALLVGAGLLGLGVFASRRKPTSA